MAVVPQVPQSMPSTSPFFSSIEPISVRRRRISILASCAVTPFRAVMLVVGLPVVAVAVVVLGVDDVVVASGFEAQAELLDALGDHLRPADQRRPRQVLVDDDLDGAQDPLLLALGEGDALLRAPSWRA